MECEIEDGVTVFSRYDFKIMKKFLWSIARKMDEFDAVVSGDEFKNRKDAEPVFEVMIPKGF